MSLRNCLSPAGLRACTSLLPGPRQASCGREAGAFSHFHLLTQALCPTGLPGGCPVLCLAFPRSPTSPHWSYPPFVGNTSGTLGHSSQPTAGGLRSHLLGPGRALGSSGCMWSANRLGPAGAQLLRATGTSGADGGCLQVSRDCSVPTPSRRPGGGHGGEALEAEALEAAARSD